MANTKPYTVWHVADDEDIKLVLEAAQICELEDKLGGRNLARDRVPEEALRAAFGLEPLLLLDPEVIFIVTMGDSEALREKFRREVMSQEAWRRLRAARAGRVHFLPSELFLYVPGMRFPKAFGYLEQLLYPEEVAP